VHIEELLPPGYLLSCVDLRLALTMWRIIVSMDDAFGNPNYTNYQIYSLCEL